MKFLTANGLIFITKTDGESQSSLNQRVIFLDKSLKEYKFNQISSKVLNDLDIKSKKDIAIKDLGCKYF